MGRIRSYLVYSVFTFRRNNQLSQFFEPEIQSWSLIFDIGAHLGDKTSFFDRYNLKVIAVEPHPYYYKKLQKKFSDNNNVVVLQYGISNEKTTLDFFVSPTHPSVSTFNQDMMRKIIVDPNWSSVKWSDSVVIPTTTLHQLISQYGVPDFIKIDVEGLEFEVIQTLKTPISFLSFEFLPAYPTPGLKTLQFLSNLGSYLFLFTQKESYKEGKWLDFNAMRDFLIKYIGHSGNIFAKLQ